VLPVFSQGALSRLLSNGFNADATPSAIRCKRKPVKRNEFGDAESEQVPV
jgi:hypothetical protein